MISQHQGTSRLDAETSEDDLALGLFLDLLDRDMAARPEAVVPIPQALFDQIEDLVRGIVVDPDAPIEGDVGL
jgi:antitoxin PrlF